MFGRITSNFDAFLNGCSPLQVGVLSMLFAVCVGLLDLITGYELSFSIFYIAPIAVASWYGERRLGVGASVFSSAIWLIVDLTSGHAYTHGAIIFWNAMVRFGFFVLISLLLSLLRVRLDAEQKLAQTDALTGLLNGRAFREAAVRLFQLCRRVDKPATVVYIDQDNFKQVNDNFGHAEGDRVLKVVGSTLSTGVRSTNLVGRLGGDESALILPDTNHAQARKVMENCIANSTTKSRRITGPSASVWGLPSTVNRRLPPTRPSNLPTSYCTASSSQAKTTFPTRSWVSPTSPFPPVRHLHNSMTQ